VYGLTKAFAYQPYFNSLFKRFAKRAPASSTRCFANVPAFFLYAVVKVNGPFPAPTGGAYTVD
jgi:hypothetical protein